MFKYVYHFVKGQSSLESLFLTSLLLLGLFAVLYTITGLGIDMIGLSVDRVFVEKLAFSVNSLSLQPEGVRDEIRVYLSPQAKVLNTSSNLLYIENQGRGGNSIVYSSSLTKHLYKTFIPNPGFNLVQIRKVTEGTVILGSTDIYCEPSLLVLDVVPGQNDTIYIGIHNRGSQLLNGFIAEYPENSFFTFFDLPSQLLPFDNQLVTVGYEIPETVDRAFFSFPIRFIDSKNNDCTIEVVFFVDSGIRDTQGPLVNLLFVNDDIYTYKNVLISGTASDFGRGNSVITKCEYEIDNSGIWNSFANGTGFASSSEVEFLVSIGTLREGFHTLAVRCIDSEKNVGEEESIDFQVKKPTSFLILLADETPSPYEQSLIDWLSTHNSGIGLDWSYEFRNYLEIFSGVEACAYDSLLVADSVSNDDVVSLSQVLVECANNGKTVILFGRAYDQLGNTTGLVFGTGGTSVGNTLTVLSNHYIFSDFSVGQVVTISTSNKLIYYNEYANPLRLAGLGSNPQHVVISQNGNLFSFGITSFDELDTNGNLILEKLFDYALNLSLSR